MQRHTIRFVCTLCLVGCGATVTPADPDPGACESSRGEAESAWSALASLVTLEPTSEAESRPIDDAVERLNAHARSLREAPPEAVDGETALALSGAVMDALDSLPDATESTRRAVDDAAEALLTERSPAGSMRAASAAVQALEDAFGGSGTGRTAVPTEDLSSVARSAQSVAEGYAEGPRVGDRRARQAEAQTTDGWATDLTEALAGAVAASREARRECDIPRTLIVPTR